MGVRLRRSGIIFLDFWWRNLEQWVVVGAVVYNKLQAGAESEVPREHLG